MFIIGGVAAVVIVIVLCLLCCGGKKEQYCSVIPKDAVAVWRVDGKSFLDKHDIDISPLLTMMTGSSDGKINIGVDFDKPIYGFALENGTFGVVAKMEDAEALSSIIGTTAGSKTKERQGYNWFEMSDIVVAYDDERLLALSGAGMNTRKIILNLLEQDANESILSTKRYDNLMGAKKPVALIFSPMQVKGANVAMAMAGQSAKAMDFDLLMTFDVEKQNAVLAADICPNSDEAKELYEKNSAYMTKISGKYVSSVCEKPFIWAAANIQGSKFVDAIKSSEAAKLLEGPVTSIFNILSSLNGDITFCMPTVDPNHGGFMFMAETNNLDVENLISLVTMQGDDDMDLSSAIQSLKVGPDAYCISNGNNPFFVGKKDNNFYVATSNDLTAKVGKEIESGLEDIKDEITNSYFYFTMDLAPVKSLMMQEPEFRTYATLFANRLSKLDRLTMIATEPTHLELRLSVKDGEDFVKAMFK